ncbi:hypothetical protein ACFWGP_06910 [Agromyces sp. NPDC127015]|uniref:hypothetical protein n=1 Tax=Agromyces sp. NPDC127015 TaxID=3347108 RepID=UPI003649781D
MDEFSTLRSLSTDAPEPTLATLTRSRQALDDRIAGNRHPSSLRRRTIARTAVALGGFVVVAGATTGAAAIVSAFTPVDYEIGLVAQYQPAFVDCLTERGWADSGPSPEGADWARFTVPDYENFRFTNDVDACRAQVADEYGVTVQTLLPID